MNILNYRSFVFVLPCVLVPLWANATEVTPDSLAEVVEFNDQFLYHRDESEKVNVSRFSKGNPVLPGIYAVTVYVNNTAEYSGNIEFKDNGTDIAVPCITRRLMQFIKLDTSELPGDSEEDEDLSLIHI